VREWGEQRAEIAGAAHGRAGKDFYVIRSGFPGGDDFSGSERAGDGELPALFCCGDDRWVETGADDEFSAGVDGGFGLVGSGDGAGTEQELACVFTLEFGEESDGAWDGHGDFNDGDAAGDHGFDDGVGLGGVAGAENGNEADAFEDLGCGFRHLLPLIKKKHGMLKNPIVDGWDLWLPTYRAMNGDMPVRHES
jgi:hypothetical protein